MFKVFSIDQALRLFVVCVIVAPIADIAAVIAFCIYKARLGYGFLEFSSSVFWDFLTTSTGAVLAGLGIIPYGIAILGLQMVRKKDV